MFIMSGGKAWRLAGAAAFASALACASAETRADTILFSDDFNRPDSIVIGNGWTSAAEPGGGFLEIRNNALSAGQIGNLSVPRAAVFRPLGFAGTLTISGRLSDSDGNPSVAPGGAFFHLIAIANNGDPTAVGESLQSGYGIGVFQNGSDGVNSYVRLFDNGVVIDTADFPDNFMRSEVDFSVSIALDGSVTGMLTNPTSLATFDFSFGPRAIQSNGGNFMYETGGNSRPPMVPKR